jgi:glyoxylase-like metal-dependent hydrolase (beta-lactamase superfamily II)
VKRVSGTALAMLLVCTALCPAASAQRRAANRSAAAAKTGSEKSYVAARRVLDAGVGALGGLAAIRAAEDVSFKGTGYALARNQSVRVDPPFERMEHDESLYANVGRGRYIFENRDPLPGGFVFGGKVVVSGGQGFFANPRDRTLSPLNPANLPAITLNYVRRLPHLLLMLARERAQTLRHLGEETFEGRRHNVVTFATANGVQMTLFFDARTNLLSKYEQMVTDPQDGDRLQETIFEGYRAVGGVQIPSRRVTTRGGEVVEDVKYAEALVNTRLPDSAFAKPEGFEELPTPAPLPTRETRLADGVYLFESGVNSLVVEFSDHTLVVEPPSGGRGPKPTINKVREMFPSKPIRYVVLTHHHDDHAGGARSYIAEDIALVTTRANRRYFERMAAGNFTITPDDQSEKRRPVRFEFVEGGRRVFADARQTVEVIDIGPSPHAHEMLVVYLPKEKLIFQGDLVNVPNTGRWMPSTVNDTTLHLYDWLRRSNLDVKRIAAVHGPPTTLEDLREAVEKKRAAR